MCIQGQRQSRVLWGVITAACLLWGQDEWSCAQCTHPRLHHHHIKAFSISAHLCLSMHISLTAPFCLYSLFRKCTWDSGRFSILFLHHFFSGENIVVIDATGTVWLVRWVPGCKNLAWIELVVDKAWDFYLRKNYRQTSLLSRRVISTVWWILDWLGLQISIIL